MLAYAGYVNRRGSPGKSDVLRVGTPALRAPAIDTASLDPAISKLIKVSLDEVNTAPRSGAAWGKLGSVLMHYGFAEETRIAFEQAEKLSSQEARWPYLHAVAIMNFAPDAALTKLQRAAELAPDQPDMPRLRLAQFLLERGRDKEAEAHFQLLLQRKPEHVPALLGFARLHIQRGQFIQSSNALNRCFEDPHTAKSATVLFATVQRALGNVSAAEEAARRSASLPPDQPWPDPFWDEAAAYRVGRKALIEDATTLMDQGRLDEALQVLAVVTRDYPNDEEGLYLIGWASNQQGRALEAERALRAHLAKSPRSAKGHAQLAVALLRQKRFAEAVDILQAAVQLKPTWRELHYNLGYASNQLGRTNEAISHLRSALERDPNYVPTYIALAELLSGRGEMDEARRLLSQALNLSPADPRATELLKRIERTQ